MQPQHSTASRNVASRFKCQQETERCTRTDTEQRSRWQGQSVSQHCQQPPCPGAAAAAQRHAWLPECAAQLPGTPPCGTAAAAGAIQAAALAPPLRLQPAVRQAGWLDIAQQSKPQNLCVHPAARSGIHAHMVGSLEGQHTQAAYVQPLLTYLVCFLLEDLQLPRFSAGCIL